MNRIGRRSAGLVPYFFALLSASAVLVCLGLADPWLQGHYYFLPLVATTTFALAFGARPALAMTAVEALGLWLWFLEPRGRLGISGPLDALYLASFFAGTSFVAAVAGAQRRARLRAQAAMHALRASQGRLNLAMHCAELGVADFDLRAGEQHLSPIARRHFGLGPNEELSLDRLPRELLPGAPERLPATREEETWLPRRTAEFRVTGGPGRPEVWLAAWTQELPDAQGRPSRLLAMTLDITERKRAEQALRASEERFRSVAEALPQLVWTFDAQGKVEFANRRCAEYFGQPEPAPDWGAAVHPEDMALTLERFQAALRTGGEYSVEHRLRRSDGVYRWFLCRAYPMRDGSGQTDQWAGTSTDIHDVKVIEQSLRGSQERLKLATDAAGLGVFTVEASSGRMVFESGCPRLAARRAPGEEPLTTADFLEHFVHPDDAETFRRAYDEAMAPGRAFRCTVRARPAGTSDWRRVEFSGRFELAADGAPHRLLAVCSDVTERVQLEEALRESARRKDEFLGVLSHELRNPLAPIRNSIYLLNRSPLSGRAQKAAAVIDRQVSQLSSLVDDLLDVTRITRGKIRLHRERLDFASLVRQTLDDLRSELKAGAVDLRADMGEEPLWMDGDSARLGQIVGNLINNALKFTPPGGSVSVNVARDGRAAGCASLVVADTGVGMDAETLSRLFQPFAQADRSLDRSRGGLGLGLALVKGLVDLHGGEVRAFSAGPGRGSRFTVQLPLAADAHPPAPALRRTGAALRRSRRILIVEDNRDTAETLREILRLSGHEVEVANDGRRGLEKARAFHPDVVLCDIGLPDLDGYSVARQLRRDAGLSSALLVALTGYARPEDRRRALEAGFDRHLSKPPDPEAVTLLLDEAPPAGPMEEEGARP